MFFLKIHPTVLYTKFVSIVTCTAWLALKNSILFYYDFLIYFTIVFNSYLIEKNLFFGSISKAVNIRNNDGNNKIYHDERTKDNEANQKSHCKHQCQSVFIIRVLNIAVDSLPRFKRFT